MAIMKHVQSFLLDLQNNESNQRRLGIGSAQIQNMLDEIRNQQVYNSIFAIAEPIISEEIKEKSKKCTIAVSSYRDNQQINRPRCIRKVGNEFWVGSTYTRIARFNSSWSFLGYWTGQYEDPNRNPNSYSYLSSFAVDETNNRLFISMDWRHRIRAFNLETGEFLWNYGDGTTGHVWDNKLWNPMDVEVLPNGNVLVCNYNGYGQIGETKATNHGTLIELNGETGEFVACRKMYQPNTDGNAWSDSVSNPVRARILADGNLYVSMYNRHHVGCWNPTDWTFIKAFTKPHGMDVGSVYPRGIFLSSYDFKGQTRNALVVVCNGPKSLGAVDAESHELVWLVGHGAWDDRRESRNIPGEFWDIWDILEIEPGYYAVADYGNNRVSVVSAEMSISIPYDIHVPEGKKIVWAPDNFDKTTLKLTIPSYQMSQVKPIPIVIG